MQSLGPGSLTLRASRPGNVVVHLHFTSYWALAQGQAASRLTGMRSG